MLTIKEYSGRVDNSIRVAFYGDGRSNMANSLILAAKLSGMELVIAAPEEERPSVELIGDAKNIVWEKDPLKAAEGVDYFYTDVWVSMGFEEESKKRMSILAPYRLDMNTLRLALVGAGKGPGMYDVTSFIGKEECLKRIDNLFATLTPAE